jgi:DNA-binding Lrp family transcriptional regulator
LSTSDTNIVNEIDEVDLKILNKLQENSRIGYEELGQSVDLAESSVRYRVKRLEELGIIKSFVSVLDARKLGFGLLVFAELDVEAGKEQAVAQRLTKLENVVGLFSVFGYPDMIAIILARTNEELTEIFDRIRGIKEVHKMIGILVLKTYKDLVLTVPIETTQKGI